MSKFSGKCDFYDYLEIIDYFKSPESFDKDIYIGNLDNKLEYSSTKELVKYFPYIIIMSFGNTIVLSSESWVESEERSLLEIYLKDIMVIYRRCKRKKINFTKEYVRECMSWSIHNHDVIDEITDRVIKLADKANVDGVRLNSKEYYRKLLQEEINKYAD